MTSEAGRTAGLILTIVVLFAVAGCAQQIEFREIDDVTWFQRAQRHALDSAV